jgi:hypothetical protein
VIEHRRGEHEAMQLRAQLASMLMTPHGWL